MPSDEPPLWGVLRRAVARLGAHAEENRQINAGAATVPAPKEGETMRGGVFDSEQTRAERDAMFLSLGATAREGLRFALVEGVLRPLFPSRVGDGPAREYMLTREEAALLPAAECRLRRLCAAWSLTAYSTKNHILFDLQGWLPTGAEIGAGVFMARDGAPRLVYRNEDCRLVALAPDAKTPLLDEFAGAK